MLKFKFRPNCRTRIPRLAVHLRLHWFRDLSQQRAFACKRQTRSMLNCAQGTCVPATAGVRVVGRRAQARQVKLCGRRLAHAPSSSQLVSFASRCRTPSALAASPMTADPPTANSQTHMEVSIPDLQHLCQDALRTLGYDHQQSLTISEVCDSVLEVFHNRLHTCCIHIAQCFAGPVICSTAQQQQQHGQGHHWWPGQIVRRKSS